MRIILASASPRRSDLLRGMGVRFEVLASQAEELHDETLRASELCEINARRKAEDVAAAHPAAVVLGADTLVARGTRVYGKPANLEQAKTMLRELSAHTHDVVTGICLLERGTGKISVFHDLTRVTFKRLTEEVIADYVAAVNVLDKAGAYGIQERGEMLVERISGSFNNVVGLPTERLAQEFKLWGIE